MQNKIPHCIRNDKFKSCSSPVTHHRHPSLPLSPRLTMPQSLHIRAITAQDDLHALTELIHAAYAPHLASGLHYVGTRQTVAITQKRLARGQGFVALLDDAMVGTLTLMPPRAESAVPLYGQPHVWTIGQFAVSPAHKGAGIGRALHDYALAQAKAQGAKVLALDTAVPATALIALYERWGYVQCGHCDWRPETNYLSVLMQKVL
jgi:GNAT superfamily N-acetyltransferase